MLILIYPNSRIINIQYVVTNLIKKYDYLYT